MLYVALTRAKERLILSVGLKDGEEPGQVGSSAGEEVSSLLALLWGAGSYGEWILMGALRHPDADKLRLLAGASAEKHWI